MKKQAYNLSLHLLGLERLNNFIVLLLVAVSHEQLLFLHMVNKFLFLLPETLPHVLLIGLASDLLHQSCSRYLVTHFRLSIII